MTLINQLDFEQLTQCPICKGTDIPTMYQINYRDLGMIHASICQDCGLNFLNPRMTDEQTIQYYSGLYRDTILENENGINQNDLKNQHARAIVQVNTIKQHLTGLHSNLEIGSSAGYLLDRLHIECDFEYCVGVEPDVRYHSLEPACNYRIYQDINEVPHQQFDLVTMSHSLEHINHPLEYMQNIIDNYTHDSSLIMIEVPNMDYYMCYGLAHPINFTQETLNGLFLRMGCIPIGNYVHGLGTSNTRKFLIGLYRVVKE